MVNGQQRKVLTLQDSDARYVPPKFRERGTGCSRMEHLNIGVVRGGEFAPSDRGIGMIIKQIIKPADARGEGFELMGVDLTPLVPDAGDIICWTAGTRAYTGKVKSKTFSYDKSEISLARADDWGVTITVIVDIMVDGALAA
jgi:hypothetical protein